MSLTFKNQIYWAVSAAPVRGLFFVKKILQFKAAGQTHITLCTLTQVSGSPPWKKHKTKIRQALTEDLKRVRWMNQANETNLTHGMYDRLYLQTKQFTLQSGWVQTKTIQVWKRTNRSSPGEGQDLQNDKQQSQSKVLPLNEDKKEKSPQMIRCQEGWKSLMPERFTHPKSCTERQNQACLQK